MKLFQAFTKDTSQFKILLGIVLLATLSRLTIPMVLNHLPNFSALNALALFCGTYFSRRSIACIVVLFSVWVGDIFLNKIFSGHWNLFYTGFYWQYSCYFLIIGIGSLLKNRVKPSYLISASFLSSILFFGISNFGVWYSGLLYPLTLEGLMACYVAAIPFFKNTLLSDLLFTMLLYASFEWIQIKFFTRDLNSFSLGTHTLKC